MEDKYLVSIVIPVYNVEKYIQECIESCLIQSYSNIEVIAVDDGSTDSSPMILDTLEKKYKNLRVIHKKNAGVSSARNCGIKNSCGDYVVFVDADDYLAKDAIEYMMQIITETSSDFAILKNCYTTVGQKQFDNKISKISNEEAVSLLLGLSMELGCWNKIYSKKLLNKHKLIFNENLFYGEGLHFIISVAQKSKRIGLGTKSVYYYRKNNLSSATSSFNYKKFENGEKSLLKVREELTIDSKRINDIWMYHYSMFAQNVLVSCINNRKELKNYKKIYKEWKNKFNLYFLRLLLSENISLIEKLKLIIVRISPQIFANIRNKKIKRMVERSV